MRGNQKDLISGKVMILDNSYGKAYNMNHIIKTFDIRKSAKDPITHVVWPDGSWMRARFVGSPYSSDAIVFFYYEIYMDQVYFHLSNLNII